MKKERFFDYKIVDAGINELLQDLDRNPTETIVVSYEELNIATGINSLYEYDFNHNDVQSVVEGDFVAKLVHCEFYQVADLLRVLTLKWEFVLFWF